MREPSGASTSRRVPSKIRATSFMTLPALALLGARRGRPLAAGLIILGLAGAALFLVSDDAGFMTAADLLVDGGYCAFKVNPDKDPRAEAQSAHKG